jgi:pimeloyl-ACP methyl ester carboxylesterase
VITRLNDRPDAYHALLPGLRVTRVAGTGHWLHLDAPEEVSRILDGFLAEVG